MTVETKVGVFLWSVSKLILRGVLVTLRRRNGGISLNFAVKRLALQPDNPFRSQCDAASLCSIGRRCLDCEYLGHLPKPDNETIAIGYQVDDFEQRHR